MTNDVFLSSFDHLITSAATGSHSRVDINRLQLSERAVRHQVNISLAAIQSSLLLLDEIERSKSLRPIALRLPERLVPGTPALRTEPRSPPIWWDVYPALPKAIRLGEIEAADEREAIERAAEKFEQDPAILIVMRRA
jgi:hypothetical protein